MLLFSAGVFAQNIEIKGRIVDAESNQPVEFANIGVIGTYLGTASDFDGYYELTVDESYVSYKVHISAVGYKTKEFTVDELYVLKGTDIKLISQSYGIQEVDVKADSKRLYGILKTASNIIEDVYEKPYSSKVYLSQLKDGQKTEAVVEYSDGKGYGDRSLANSYAARNYNVAEVRRDFEVTPLKDGLLYANDLLAFDIVRQRGNVLDVSSVDAFKLELAKEDVVGGNAVWVINYSLDKPDVAKTGDAYCKAYKGVIVIRQNDYSVVRNELEFVSTGFFHAGRDAYREDVVDTDYTVKVTTDYRKTANNKYALGKIVYSGKSAEESLEAEWIVYDYSIYRDGGKRSFYTDNQQNKDFWSRFKFPAKKYIIKII
jgi:hypothetical protein